MIKSELGTLELHRLGMPGPLLPALTPLLKRPTSGPKIVLRSGPEEAYKIEALKASKNEAPKRTKH